MVERAVYSLWTKPMNGEFVGFNSELTLMESFALSLHYSKKWFKEVHLVTDFKGKELVEKWGLEFDHINTDLESQLNGIDKSNWALGKIYACKIQDKPFIHIDNDVFLFKPLPENFLKKECAFQNLELHSWHTFYGDMISYDKNNYNNPPKWYKFPKNKNGQSFCCGVILFNKLDVLEEWWEEALKYVDYLKKNGRHSEGILSASSLIFEQHFIASICKHHKLKVGFLTDYQTKPNADMTYIDDDLAKELGYTHMLSTSKRKLESEEMIRERLLLEGINLNAKNNHNFIIKFKYLLSKYIMKIFKNIFHLLPIIFLGICGFLYPYWIINGYLNEWYPIVGAFISIYGGFIASLIWYIKNYKNL